MPSTGRLLCGIPQKIRTPLLDDIKLNERRNNRLMVGAKKESSIAFVNDSGFVKMESRLVVNENPPEFFDLVGKVLTKEEINHPVATLVTAFQEKELTPLMVIQLHNVKRGCGGTEISETDGYKHRRLFF